MVNVEHYKFEFRGNVLYLNTENYVFKYAKNNSEDYDVKTFIHHNNLLSKLREYQQEVIEGLPSKIFINMDESFIEDLVNFKMNKYINRNYVYFILKEIDISKGLAVIETPDGEIFYSNRFGSIYLEKDFMAFQNDKLEKYLTTLSNDNYNLNIEKNIIKEIFASKSFIVKEK